MGDGSIILAEFQFCDGQVQRYFQCPLHLRSPVLCPAATKFARVAKKSVIGQEKHGRSKDV